MPSISSLSALLGLAAMATAAPANLQPRFPGLIYEKHEGRSTAGEVGALASRLIPVVVGGTQVTFVPNIVRASVGDIVQFQFSSGNHTVTQSAENTPCIADPAGIHSGHIPFKAGQAEVGTFNMPITSDATMFLFCATGPHCQEGQVMVINPTNDNQLLDYAKKAQAAAKSVDGKAVAGGQVAKIPLGAASFTPAKEDAGGGAPPPAAPPAASKPAAAPPAASKPAAAPPAASKPAASPPAASPPAASPPPAGGAAPPAGGAAPPAATTAPAATPAKPAEAGAGQSTTTTTITVQPPAAKATV